MFKPVLKNGILIGHEHISEGVHIFYGTKACEYATLAQTFPYNFRHLKQVHGNTMVETHLSSENGVVADAHWTQDSDVALLIQTADCLPIFGKSQNKVFGIHAGWRGVQNRIVPLTIGHLKLSICEFFVGPFIHSESFEVDKDVCDQLASCTQSKNSFFSYSHDRKKYYPDLLKIVEAQIKESIKSFHVHLLSKNTYTQSEFSSFRRERSACRNWSFIVRQ